MDPLRPTLSLSGPDISEDEVQTVCRVLRSGRLSLGPYLDRFEEQFARTLGSGHAVGVNSGTSALHLCVRAMGLGPDDEVITTPFSFVASANCLLYEGVRPVFVDIDPLTLNMAPENVATAVTERTRALLPVHVFGLPCDMPALMGVAHRHGLAVIEDACEAVGATSDGRPVGTWGRCGVFAFYPNKQITTGEGGMVVTDDRDLAGLCRSLRNQGRSDDGAWLEHVRLGYNYRLDELSAALGVCQLRRLDRILARRQRVADLYRQGLSGVKGITLPAEVPDAVRSWFVYVVLLGPERGRAQVMERLSDQGVPSRAYFPPIHLLPFYRERFGFRPGQFPVTEDVASRSLALPFHGNLSPAQVDYVCQSLGKSLE